MINNYNINYKDLVIPHFLIKFSDKILQSRDRLEFYRLPHTDRSNQFPTRRAHRSTLLQIRVQGWQLRHNPRRLHGFPYLRGTRANVALA